MPTTLAPVPAQYYPNNNNTGAPAAGFKLFTYVAGQSTKQNTWTDSTQAVINANPLLLDANGFAAASASASVWLDPTLVYKFVWAPANDTDPPSSPIRTIDNIRGPLDLATLTSTVIGSLLYPRTAAEISASVTPTIYVPSLAVDVQRYGAVDDGTTDNTAAINLAIAVCIARGGGKIKLPIVIGQKYKVLSALTTISVPIEFEGDDHALSCITTPNDITVLSFVLAGSQSVILGMGFEGKGAGATQPALLFTNSNQNTISRSRVTGFGYGARFLPGANSSYLNFITESRMENNRVINIAAGAKTNGLRLDRVTFGGGNTPIGLQVLDSNALSADACDCEGVTTCAVDLDSPSGGTSVFAGHVFSGIDLDSNVSSAGDFRIGLTNVVRGVSILGGYSNPGTGCDCGINGLNVDGLTVLGHTVAAGYFGGVGYIRRGNVTNERILLGGVFAGGFSQTIASTGKVNYSDAGSLTLDAATTYDAAYADSSRYNLYKTNSASVTASKNYYGGLDVLRVLDSGAPGASSALYARRAIASSARAGVNARAFKADGALDQTQISLTYSASIDTDASLANIFDIAISNGTAFTINAPSNAVKGQKITYSIRNGSGGAAGALTWNAIFKLSAWTQPANTFGRMITFYYNGTNWIEVSRTTVDVPN